MPTPSQDIRSHMARIVELLRPLTLTHGEPTDITGLKITLGPVTLEVNRAMALTLKLDGGRP